MGEVYRARDTKLDRDVAIKILPEAFAQDTDRLARFQREAKTLASLNHPNIAIIHGLEQAGDVHALVMELVEGDDLSQRIARGAIPLDEALPIAKQIAEALEAAHEQGIIHRDLKPANIKVRSDGNVKVLDFGLAKALEPAAGSSPSMSMSPTLSLQATQAGMILGTAGYMSPEQARGKTVDKRADIWAFGAVLYEMLTGTRAFEGEDIADTLGNVMKVEPSWQRFPASMPPRVVQVIRACLQKNPKQRIDSAQDVRLALEGAFDTATSQMTGTTTSSTRRGRLAWMTALAIAAVVIAALAIPALRHLREVPPPEPPVMRFTIAPPDGVTPTSPAMISPDGTRVVFAGAAAGGGGLYLWPLDALTAQRLPATEGAASPFWSPDSKSVGFFSGGKLKKIDITGGPAVPICDVQNAGGGSWSRNGVIVFAPNNFSGLQQVSAAGGTPTPATVLDAKTGAVSHRWPQFLPDGEHFLYFNLGAQGSTGIFVTSLGSKMSTSLVSTNVRAEYALPGALLFLRGTTLMRQPFDTAGLRLTGDPAQVAEDIGLFAGSVAAFSVSHTGVLVYSTGQAAMNRRLVWVDRRGGVTPLTLAPGDYDSPALSPDGQHIALTVRDATGAHIWVYDIARGTLGKRTFEGADNFPIWTRDGKFLTFQRARDLIQVRADGSGNAEPLVRDLQLPGQKVPTSWSADSRLLAIQNGTNVVVRDTDGVFHPTLTTSAFEREGRFAPDGHWLAYRSDETGRDEVFVQSYPPGGGKWLISTDGGAQAMWAPNGRELFYKSGNRMMVVEVELGTAFKASTPRVLFEMPLPESITGDPSRFAVTPDAQRFLVLTTATGEKGAASTPPLTVVLNYAQALKR
jgi:serine/threonine protein kinase/Tol biopolymer transport system component